MVKSCLQVVFCLLFTTTIAFGQIEFEPGYYITNEGEKVVGQIGNELWRLAPEKFVFINQSGEERTITLAEASEFSIEGKEKFIRATVEVDISPNAGKSLTESRSPIFETRTAFLLVHREGKASLYQYLWEGAPRFFLSTDRGENFVSLVCKLYRPSSNQIGENNQFRQQLLANLSEEGVVLEDVRSLGYTARALSKLIDDVNGVEPARIPLGNFIRERTEIGARAGITFWTLDLESRYAHKFGPSVGGQIGVDFAVIFPLERFSLATTISPNFRYMGLSEELETQSAKIKYVSLDVPFGLRIYSSFGESTRFFAGGGYNLVVNIDGSRIDYSRWYDLPLLTSFGSNAFYGELGFTLNQRYSFGAIYQRRDVFPTWLGGFNMTSLVFGINL